MPHDTTIRIDGRQNLTAGNKATLAPGNHTLVASRKDFASKTTTVTVVVNQLVEQDFALTPANSDGYSYLNAHPEEIPQGEGASGAEIEAGANRVTRDNPLVLLLPYYGADFSVDAGVSVAHKGEDGAVAIYVTAKTAAAQTKALNWIRAQGYNPSAYEIIYVGASQ